MIDPHSLNCYAPDCDATLKYEPHARGECPQCCRTYNLQQRAFAQKNPNLYLQTVDLPGGHQSTVLNLAEQQFNDEVLGVYGVWAVTSNGIECLRHGYPIEKSRLHSEDWVRQVSSKPWVIIEDFVMALDHAKSL